MGRDQSFGINSSANVLPFDMTTMLAFTLSTKGNKKNFDFEKAQTILFK